MPVSVFPGQHITGPYRFLTPVSILTPFPYRPVSRAQSFENLRRGALARLDGSIHEARPACRGLAAGKVDATARCSQGGPYRRQDARRMQTDVAAGAPLVLAPVAIEVARR